MLQTGDIVFYTRKKVLGWIIKKITKSEVSHCGIILKIDNKPKLIEATECGITISNLDVLNGKQFNIKRHKSMLGSSRMNTEKLSNRIASKIGIKYDYTSLVFFQLIYQLTGKWYGRKSTGDDRFYCSEFCAWVYDVDEWWKKSPKDLYNSDEFVTIYNNTSYNLFNN